MRKTLLFFISLLLMLTLSACWESNVTYTGYMTHDVDIDGRVYHVDAQNKTISDGTHTYQYTFSGNTREHKITVTYPNGSHYYYDQTDGYGSGTWTHGADKGGYAKGDVLCRVITATAPKGFEPPSIEKLLVSSAMLVFGVLLVVNPKLAGRRRIRWAKRMLNAVIGKLLSSDDDRWTATHREPSDEALPFYRIAGILLIIFTVYYFFK